MIRKTISGLNYEGGVAKKVALPGVFAFRNALRRLRKRLKFSPLQNCLVGWPVDIIYSKPIGGGPTGPATAGS
jgi:hypothetical protein